MSNKTECRTVIFKADKVRRVKVYRYVDNRKAGFLEFDDDSTILFYFLIGAPYPFSDEDGCKLLANFGSQENDALQLIENKGT